MLVFGTKRMGAACFAVAIAVALLAGCGQDKPAAVKEASPEQLRQVERLNDTADQMYRYVMEGEIEKARDKLDEIGGKLTEIRFEGMATVEGVSALSESVVQAKRTLQSVRVTREDAQAAAAKIRLATDALTHDHQPMWLQYYKGMKENVHQLGQAIQLRSKQEAAGRLQQLYGRYDMIRPSLLISKQPSDVEKMDSLFTFMRSQLSQPELDPKQAGSGVEHMEQAIDDLFGRHEKAAYAVMVERPLPYTWVFGIGSIIVAVLGFAAWRIFRFERGSFR
ncbi:sporulation protein YpjB [Paenibacillus flagellatus]|uniref:Sporulation protein n=1 Tax=Paenibacillus flagellatus TaxID=2211139 RepID=A0A2V5K683_9BACL|nr:sporulation protein YpjB [Paenibacillus flagellatus]PYI54895.1 hypothetical protein DLM86_10110 [Paenibacillus flagellatus]